MSELLEILYHAFGSPCGIAVQVSDVKNAMAKFYKARKEAGDPDLMTLKIHVSPFLPEEELWITNGKPVSEAV